MGGGERQKRSARRLDERVRSGWRGLYGRPGPCCYDTVDSGLPVARMPIGSFIVCLMVHLPPTLQLSVCEMTRDIEIKVQGTNAGHSKRLKLHWK